MPDQPPEARHDTIGALVTALTREHGMLPAIIDRDGAATFSDIDGRSLKIAQGLLAAGVAKGARVGILMPNGQAYLAALLGVMRMGGVAVLLSTLARPPELAHMIRNADIDTVLAAPSYLNNNYVAMLEDALPSLRGADPSRRLVLTEAPFLRSIWIWGADRPTWSPGDEEAIGRLADAGGIGPHLALAAQSELTPADPALIIYTSGSGAEPKAVVHSQGNVVRQGKALAGLIACAPGDRLLSTLPFFWVGGLCTVVLAAITSGTAVLCPDDPSPAATIACIRRWKATHIMQWPQQLDLMRDDPEFIAALAQMRPAYATQAGLFGLAPNELTANSLGMTETLGPHSMYHLAPLPADRKGSFGTAVGSIERRIIDPETGTVLPPGNSGTLCLRGGSLMIGLHRKEHREVFDNEGFYRTDDICALSEDGHLFFIGRANDIVKVSGANVSPVEVEAVIRAVPGIKAVTVVGVPDANQVESLVAAIVLEEGARVSASALRAYLKSRLSSYKVPRHVVFMHAEDVPMTATAKVYRPALKRVLAAKLFGR